MRLRNPLFLLMMLTPIVCACAGEPSTAGRDLSTWQVASEPMVTIGGSDERPDYLIERVADATRLSDGTILVVDGGSSELRFYSQDGGHVRTIGGEGQGPGELRMPLDLVRLPGDTLLVLSISPGLTWYSPDGDFLRQETFSVWSVPSGDCRMGEGSWQLSPERREPSRGSLGQFRDPRMSTQAGRSLEAERPRRAL